ncbi:MAG: hypothetical protein KTR32_42810 [Granulosicoccus sp.]|nr:hypothetical protein [Granulosicoccus sp.]
MNTLILKTISILWLVWGFVHMFAGIVTINREAPDSVAGVADAVDRAEFTGSYHPAADALINQHGFNLLWIGLVTMVCAVIVWRNKSNLFFALLTAAIVGGLADVGYFIFMDLGGYVRFMPGTVMTIFSGAAILLSIWIWLSDKKQQPS